MDSNESLAPPRGAVHLTRLLTARADAVWRLLSDGDRVERWFDWVAETVLRGSGEGGLKEIRMKDGTVFKEYVSLNDERTRTYQYYAPDRPLPIKHVIGTQRIGVDRDGRATLSWLVTFDLTRDAPRDLLVQLEAIYGAALEKIDALARALP